MLINRLDTIQDLNDLFKGLNDHLYRYVLTRCYNRVEIAEEITQEVFIKAWEKREMFDSKKSSLKNWMYIMARNMVIDYHRTNKEILSLNEELDLIDNQLTDEPENALLLKDILRNLKKLKDEEQEVIILRYIQDLEIDDISKIINKNKIATKVMIHRALVKLKKIMQ